MSCFLGGGLTKSMVGLVTVDTILLEGTIERDRHGWAGMTTKSVIAVLERALAKVQRAVEEEGAYVMAVQADPEPQTPAYSHTVGPTEKGLPELLVFGVQAATANLLLRPRSSACSPTEACRVANA